MTWAPGPVVTRRRLGGELKRLRDEAGLKLEDVAKKLECSPSKVSRLENGKGIPRVRDVRDMLEAYGVTDDDERERLLEWARTGRQPMWWQAYADVLDADAATYVELEWDAARIWAFESHIVHGLLQTRDYARAVLEQAYRHLHSSADIERLVDVRMRRQEALASDHGLTFCCVLDESTLYRVVGSSSVLKDQLDHLVGIALASHVDVRVLPFSAGFFPAGRESFAKLEFSAGIEKGMIYVERQDEASEFSADPPFIYTHDERMRAVLSSSLSEDESVPLIQRAAERIAVA